MRSRISLIGVVQIYGSISATRSWDMAPYMVFAQFNLIQNGRQVSEASFKLKGNGGLALNKWRSTEIKINELTDQLLEKN